MKYHKLRLKQSVKDTALLIALLILFATIAVVILSSNKSYSTSYEDNFKSVYAERKNDMDNYLNKKKSATELEVHIAQNKTR